LNIVIGRFGFPSGRSGRLAGAAAYSSAHSRSPNRAAAGSCDQILPGPGRMFLVAGQRRGHRARRLLRSATQVWFRALR
jgi:hypothetical protein